MKNIADKIWYVKELNSVILDKMSYSINHKVTDNIMQEIWNNSGNLRHFIWDESFGNE